MALILLLALAVRVWAATTAPMIQLDETVYAHMAESLNRGLGAMEITGGTSVNFMPAYPFFIAAVATVAGSYVVAGKIVSITFALLVVVLTYILTRDLAGVRTGLMAAALMAVEPLFLDFSSRLYSESTFMFFLLAAVIYGRYMLRNIRVTCGLLGGAALGVAYLLNPIALFYLGIFVVAAAVVAYRRKAWLRTARSMGAFILMFLVFAVPYVFFLHENLDRWTYTGKNPGLMFNAENNIQSGTPEWDKVMLRLTDDGQDLFINSFEDYPDPVSNLVNHPVTSAKVFLRQVKLFYFEKLPLAFPLWLLPLMGLGLFGAVLDRRRAAAIGYLLLMMAPGLMLFNIDSVPRYFLAYLPFVVIITAMGWARLEDWAVDSLAVLRGRAAGSRGETAVRGAAAALVLIPLLLFTLTMVTARHYPVVFKYAGQWIGREYGGDRALMSHEYATTYYADGHVTVLPYADYDAMVEFAKLKGIDLLVVGEEYIRERVPMYSRLLGQAGDHPEWRLVNTFEGEGGKVLVFERNGGSDRPG